MSNEQFVLIRKERVGIIAAAALVVGCLLLLIRPISEIGGLLLSVAWIFGAYWVGLDASYRKARVFWWTVFAALTGPIGIGFYFVSRPPMPACCYQCGATLYNWTQECGTCGYRSTTVQLISAIETGGKKLLNSVSRDKGHTARDRTLRLAIVCAALALLGFNPIAIAAYWVLTAWWVYLDATWRKMNPVPWGLLTLVTNIFGVVTYLVIRNPDPKLCRSCGAIVETGLKCCPYCGAETECVCPTCQASVESDWLYCPVCASKLPEKPCAVEQGEEAPIQKQELTIMGTVMDANSGSPIPCAEVRIDSKSQAISAKTDPLGRFILSGLDVHPYVLVASCEGYADQVKTYMPSHEVSQQVRFQMHAV